MEGSREVQFHQDIIDAIVAEAGILEAVRAFAEDTCHVIRHLVQVSEAEAMQQARPNMEAWAASAVAENSPTRWRSFTFKPL